MDQNIQGTQLVLDYASLNSSYAPTGSRPIPPSPKTEREMLNKDAQQQAALPEKTRNQETRDVSPALLVEEIQEALNSFNIRIHFEIQEKSGELIVQILDRDTGELIRRIPPEELAKISQKLDELRGILFDEQV